MAGPFAAGLGQLICDPYPRSSAGVGADEQSGAPLGGAELGVQAGAALEGFLSDDGRVVPLGTTHGAFDGGRPVLVGAVLAAPLQAKICHPRSRQSPQLIAPPPSLPPAGPPFFTCFHSLTVTEPPVSPAIITDRQRLVLAETGNMLIDNNKKRCDIKWAPKDQISSNYQQYIQTNQNLFRHPEHFIH